MDRQLEAVARKFGIEFMGVDAQLQRTEKERGGLDALGEGIRVKAAPFRPCVEHRLLARL